MPTAKSPEFAQAIADVEKLKSKPSDTELLELYGLFKQGTQDPPIGDAPAPGTFDLKGKAKRKAWQRVVDKGTTPEEAQAEYVALVEKLKGEKGFEG